MDPIEYRNFLLSKIPKSKSVSGGREVNCRCMYCSDSNNSNKGHFYISIPRDESEPSMFDCKKCPAHGMVTNSKLIEWGIYDAEMGIKLNLHNKKLGKSSNKLYTNNEIYNIRYSNITDDKLTKYKLSYINNRLGINLSYDDCIKEKIILNMLDLIKQNNLTPTRHKYIMECLDTSFIGFLSYDNSYINMRNLQINEVPSSIDKRYINYNIFNNIDNTRNFYVIPNKINLFNTNPIELHVAEGPFDILSIYHNVRKTMDNCIYAAAIGSGYKGLIRYFINNLRLINIIIHIYPDADIQQYKMEDIADLLYPFKIPIYIHRNTMKGEKDFGVPISKIKESVERIL